MCPIHPPISPSLTLNMRTVTREGQDESRANNQQSILAQGNSDGDGSGMQKCSRSDPQSDTGVPVQLMQGGLYTNSLIFMLSLNHSHITRLETMEFL